MLHALLSAPMLPVKILQISYFCFNSFGRYCWGRFLRGAELEKIVDQDLSRLYPEDGSYFQTPRKIWKQISMADIVSQ
jgi:hypothetical protein